MTTFLRGQSKIFFYSEKGYSKGKKIAKARSKGKRYLLTSYYVYDFIQRAPRDDNGNVMLMAQGDMQDFILLFAA